MGKWSPYAKKVGIYQIRNVFNGRVYIGSSFDIAARWREHKYDLRMNRHRNQHLQNAYNKYGKDAFVYEVLEILDEDQKELQFEREQYWIDLKEACNKTKGYNIQKEVLVVPRATKKVVCLETKEVFNSLEEAGKTKGINSGSISCCCNKRKLKQTGGYHWRFYDEYVNMTEEEIEEVINDKWKRIVCLETGEVFKSYHETGLKKCSVQNCCSQTAKGNIIACFGKHYLYKEDYDKLSKDRIDSIINYKPEGYKGSGEVVCLETMITYKNAREASLKTGIVDSGIIYACLGKYKTYKTYHWLFKKEFDKLTKDQIEDILLTSSWGKPVICLETGKKFKSAREAAKYMNVHTSLMCAACKGKVFSIHKFHFLYKETYDNLSKTEIIKILNQKRKDEKACKDKIRKKVRCVETGEIFNSVTEAAKSVGSATSNISKCCKTPKYICKGYHWEYV